MNNRISSFIGRYPKVSSFSVATLISIFYVLNFHQRSLVLNLLWIPAFVLIIYLSVFRFFNFGLRFLTQKKGNKHDWYQNSLYFCSLLFFFYATMSFDLNFHKFGLFTVWLWINTYFMIIMSSNVFYKKTNQDLISNILYLIKIGFVVIIFVAVVLATIPNFFNDDIQRIVNYVARSGIQGILASLAGIAMIFEIIKLTLTNFIK